MRKRTEKEKNVLGKVEVIFRALNIKKTTRGYVPLLDIIIYAYAFPEEGLLDIVNKLSKENYYVGVADEAKADTDCSNMLLPAIVRTIETAIERAGNEYLRKMGLDKLSLIVREEDIEKLEPQLLTEIGEEKYCQYTHNERILVYFAKKILKKL